MDLTPANLGSMFTGFTVKYNEAYDAAPVFWDKIAMLTPSSTESQLQAWIDVLPTMRQWIGPRVKYSPFAHSRVTINLPFELTIGIDKFKVQDDTYGVYNPTVAMMGYSAKKWPDQTLAALIQANPVGWDGVTFFNTAHPRNTQDGSVGTYSNTLTLTLSAANYATARAQMMGFIGANGQPMSLIPNLLVVPPQLEGIARAILNSDFVATAAGTATENNVWKGSAELLVIPEFANQPTVWYLLSTNGPIKPFVWQLRQAPMLVSLMAPNDQNVFFQKEFVMGLEARGAADIALPFLAIRSVGP